MVTHAQYGVALQFALMFELQEKGRMICLHLNSSEQVVFLLVDSEMVAHFVWNHKCEYF